MKLVIDMNLSPRWARVLAEAGFEAQHWSNIGDPTAPDEEIMALAAERDFIVLTNDLDFGAILAATRGGKPSVVQSAPTISAPMSSDPLSFSGSGRWSASWKPEH